jgi:ribosome biogenesis protein Nip4
MSVRTLQEFCAQFGCEPPKDTVKLGRRWFCDPHGIAAWAREQGWDTFSAGIYIGEERGAFKPTSALLDTFEGAPRTVVDEKAAWLIVCGKDVLMEGVRVPSDAPVRSMTLIADEDGHVLGCGEVRAEHNRKAKHRMYVKTLLDRGEYLRRERG